MPTSSPHQLFLLADHLKLTLLERQRAITLNLEPDKQDCHISRSLSTLQEGIEALDSQAQDLGQADDTTSDLSRLRMQHADLSAQFHGTTLATPSPETRRPNDPSLAPDFAAAQSRPAPPPPGRNKSVRFRDNPDDDDAPTQQQEAGDDAADAANRAALFAGEHDRYRDDPPDHAALDNRQIHAHHAQVLRGQDEQLDALGASVGRQRMLGIQMGDELDEQNELLQDVERGVDRHGSTLERAQKRLGHVARKSRDNWSWVTIGILIVVLVLLIVVLN